MWERDFFWRNLFIVFPRNEEEELAPIVFKVSKAAVIAHTLFALEREREISRNEWIRCKQNRGKWSKVKRYGKEQMKNGKEPIVKDTNACKIE